MRKPRVWQTETEAVSARGIARSASIILICRVACQLLGFFGAWLLAKHLQPELYGRLVFAFTYVAAFEVLAVLGTGAIMTRELSHLRGEEAAGLWQSALVLRILLFAVALAVAWCGAAFWFRNAPEMRTALLWASLGLVVGLRGAYIARLRAEMHADWNALVSVGRSLVYVTLAAWVALTSGSLVAILQGSLAATLMALLVERALVRRSPLPAVAPTNKRVRWILAASWPLALSSMLTILQMRIDVFMLRAFCGDVSVGIYGVALKLTEASFIVPAAIGASTYPVLVRAFHRSREWFDRLSENLLVLFLFLGVPFAAILCPLARPVVLSLFGETFASSGSVLAVLCLHVPLAFVNTLFVNILICARRQRLELIASLLTTATNVTANILLIPVLGPVGAAWATLACQCVALVALGLMLSRTAPFRASWRPVAVILLFGIFVSLGTFAMRDRYHWSVVGTLAGALYLLACGGCVYPVKVRQFAVQLARMSRRRKR